MKQKGFTLIELLVVIAIIGLLASIVLVSLNSARGKARNVKRNADIEQLRTAFNMAYDTAGSFPSTTNWVCVSKSCYGGWGSSSGYIANSTVDNFFTPYMVKPDDPADSSRGYGGYLYRNSWAGGSGYDGTFAAGVYFTWLLESVTVTSGVCGPGRVLAVSSGYIQCALKID